VWPNKWGQKDVNHGLTKISNFAALKVKPVCTSAQMLKTSPQVSMRLQTSKCVSCSLVYVERFLVNYV
jgi:hypothetical protein